MSVEAILGVIIACLAGLLLFYIQHIVACNARERQRAKDHAELSTQLAVISSTINDIKDEIGDHESGMRGQLHDHSGTLSQLVLRVNILDHLEGKR